MCVWQKRKNIAMASGVKNRGMCVDSCTAADKHTSRWVFVRRLQCKAYKNTHKTTTNRSSSVTELLSPIYILLCIEETLPWSRSSPAKLSCSFTVLRVLSSFHVAWHWTESSPLYAHLQLACHITTMLVWLAMDDICIESMVYNTHSPPLCLLHRIKTHTLFTATHYCHAIPWYLKGQRDWYAILNWRSKRCNDLQALRNITIVFQPY